MKGIDLGNGSAIFILFFGVSLLDAFESSSWTRAAGWLAVAFVFLVADNYRRSENL